jgi:hypothetical protein
LQWAVSPVTDGDTLWLTQDQIADLFGRERSVIAKHLRNIYKEEELLESTTRAKFAQVRFEGEREVSREIEHYNLEAIVSVGYRVNSRCGTLFRQWATRALRDHLTQGWTLGRVRMELPAMQA